MARRPARPGAQPCPGSAARSPRAEVDRHRPRPGRGGLAFRAGRALPAGARPLPHPLPHRVADAPRRRSPDLHRPRGGRHRAPGRVRRGGGVQPRVQAPPGLAPRTVARTAPAPDDFRNDPSGPRRWAQVTLPALSVLDLVPVRSGQATADALASTLSLARVADRLGYQRYWLAEHHNMPAVAATNPPVLIALVAGATDRIRVGSGGVMLPNHAPLVVAEQFALLEAAFPGRIDLGIGRAPGSDPVTSYALRHGAGGVSDEAVNRFPEYVDNVLAMMEPAGVGLSIQGRTYPLKATPGARSVPTIWLLGSSDYSARLAAEKGMPYVFAHHFSGSGTAEALELYRSTFRPSPELLEPRTFLTVNAVVAETEEEAARLALPQLQAMLAL